jgi:hypothetical protein
MHYGGLEEEVFIFSSMATQRTFSQPDRLDRTASS